MSEKQVFYMSADNMKLLLCILSLPLIFLLAGRATHADNTTACSELNYTPINNISSPVVISQVLYDAEGSDTGKEFVEIFSNNDGNVRGMLELYSGNGGNPDDWTLELRANVTLFSHSFYLIGENNISVELDTTTNLDLGNGPDSARIIFISNGETFNDTVGWGSQFADSEYYEGTPAIDVEAGRSIMRKSCIYNNSFFFIDRNNNSRDFFSSEPSPRNSPKRGNESLALTLNVMNEPPSLAVSLPDDSSEEGTQIMPAAGRTRILRVAAEVTDANGWADIKQVRAILKGSSSPAILQNKTLERADIVSETEAAFEANLSMPFYLLPGDYYISVSATDNSTTSTVNRSFTYLKVSSVSIDAADIILAGAPGETVELIGDLDFSTSDRATIRNTGNTPVNIGILSTDFIGPSIIPASSVDFTFLDNDFSSASAGTLSSQLKIINLNLQPGEDSLREFSLRTRMPFTLPGAYSGKISIFAISSE